MGKTSTYPKIEFAMWAFWQKFSGKKKEQNKLHVIDFIEYYYQSVLVPSRLKPLGIWVKQEGEEGRASCWFEGLGFMR